MTNNSSPLLFSLYLIQTWLYHCYLPEYSSDINLFLGIGLATIISGFQIYDFFHRAELHSHLIEMKFDLLPMKRKIHYQHISRIEIRNSHQGFALVTLHLKDRSVYHLHHVDSPELIKKFIEEKLLRRGY